MSKTLPLVSVIITTKNEEKNIENCLQSIKLQTYPQKNIEIIVVDNNSTDKTKEITKNYTSNIFNFGPERSAQRNFGMLKKAKGKYLLYSDADMILSSTVIEQSVDKLEKENVVALYIPEIILGNSYWSKVRRFERSFYDATLIDCARVIRADVFKTLKGFDESLTGPEDWDLDKRLRKRGKVVLLSKYDYEKINLKLEAINSQEMNLNEKLFKLVSSPVIFHNESVFNLKKYLFKKNYYSKSFDKYIQKWGKNDPDIKKQFGFIYRYFQIFLENKKWKKIFSKFDLFLGIFFLRMLVGVFYLYRKIK